MRVASPVTDEFGHGCCRQRPTLSTRVNFTVPPKKRYDKEEVDYIYNRSIQREPERNK